MDIYFDPQNLQPETIELLQKHLNIARFIKLLEAELPKLDLPELPEQPEELVETEAAAD